MAVNYAPPKPMSNPAEQPQSETSKHRHLVLPYCNGNGADLGSAGDPIVPWAVQVDLPQEQYSNYNTTRPIAVIHWRGDARELPFKDRTLDFVHSAHLLEDFKDWIPVLREWDRVLKTGGHMIISVPDHERFRAAVRAGQGDNLGHKHESAVGELSRYFRRYEIVMDQFVNDDPREYSIVFVGQKKPGAFV